MPYRALRVREGTEALTEVKARMDGVFEALNDAMRVIQERELHVKRALDILGRGDETRDLVSEYREMGMPLDGADTPSAAH